MYGVGPRSCRIILAYWDRLKILACTGGYYIEAFQGFRGVTQVNPLPPNIFNVVVDAVMFHWDFLVTEGVKGPYGWIREVLFCAAFFYIDYGLIASTNPEWLQRAFNTLTGLFKRVGLHTNAVNIVSILCCPYFAAGTQS